MSTDFSLESPSAEQAPEGITQKTGTLDLRLCDCMDLMREFPDKYFDLAIVDPPYGIGEDGKSNHSRSKLAVAQQYTPKAWDKAIPPIEYFAELRRVSRRQVIWGGNYFPLPCSRCWTVWDKENPAPNFSDIELAWMSFDKVSKKVKIPSWGAMHADGTTIHPTQKPVKLYTWLLENYAKPGQRILDTHLGSGSHAIACHYFGAHLTACEIDADYFREASARIARETAQTTLF